MFKNLFYKVTKNEEKKEDVVQNVEQEEVVSDSTENKEDLIPSAEEMHKKAAECVKEICIKEIIDELEKGIKKGQTDFLFENSYISEETEKSLVEKGYIIAKTTSWLSDLPAFWVKIK